MSQQLLAGIGRRDITPALGTYLAGYPDPNRHGQSVRDPLAATALVLEQGQLRAAIISMDLALVDDATTAEIRRRSSEATGIPAEHITVATTQTHSGPMAFDCFGWGEKDTAYVDFLVPLAADAVAIAAGSVAPATVGIASTQSDVGVNRRKVTEDGRVELSYNPWGPYDPEMIVMRFEGASGTIATVVNYGAHPTVAGMGTRGISRDWPGIMIDRVEGYTGAPAIYLNGAVGDIAPRSTYQSCVGDGEEAMQEVGTRAAMDAMRAYRSIREFRTLPLGVHVEDIIIPYRPLPSAEETQKKLAEFEQYKDDWGMQKCHYMHWHAVSKALAGTVPVQTSKRIADQIICLGPAAFVPFPGEPFAETILRLKQYSPFQYTMCISTCNGLCGYFPTAEALGRGGYEVEVARAYGAYIVAENIDDELVTQNLRMLRAAHG